MTDFQAIRDEVMKDILADFGKSEKNDPIADTAKSINEVAVDAAIKVLRAYERQKEHGAS